jgi:hypothetical protein
MENCPRGPHPSPIFFLLLTLLPQIGCPSPSRDHPCQIGEGRCVGPPGWVTVFEENFEELVDFGSGAWQRDSYPDEDCPFSDKGQFFQNQGVRAPLAYRLSRAFGKDGWLTVESYTRDRQTALNQLVRLVPDAEKPSSRVLRLRSGQHTDATIIRSTQPLPSRYRITLRVGNAQWGDGLEGKNGYSAGDEQAEPWGEGSATGENGFYWLAILDTLPRPHNNVYIHHHRKVVIDSDNHYPHDWMEIFDGTSFKKSGKHPLMMFVLDGQGAIHQTANGKAFISYAAQRWQPSGAIRAVDAYLERTWYSVSITRELDRYILEISGRFAYGGNRSYRGEIRTSDVCIWHYNRPGEKAREECLDEKSLPELPGFPLWPAAKGWPEYFMFGDPHNNYYEGQVDVDEVKLEVWQD